MRYLSFFIFILSLLFFPIANEIKQLDLFSQSAGYDGEELKLDGKIQLSHPLGTLVSKKASLKKKAQPSENKSFSSILLENKVKLKLQNGGLLEGEKVLYNIKTYELEFIKSKNKIKYRDEIKQKDGSSIPYSIFSDRAINTLGNDLTKDPPLFNFLGNVNIKFDKRGSIRGEKALFKRGKITVSRKNKKSHCIVKSKKLKIYSDLIEISLKDQLFTLENPIGLFMESMRFSAKRLIYNDLQKKMILAGKATLRDKKFALFSENIDIFLQNKQIEKIIFSKDAKITLKNDRHSKITSTRPIIFDLAKKTILCGEEENQSSICYEDDFLLVFAKKGELLLSSMTSPYTIEAAILENDIYFISTDNKGVPSYGIAEKLTFLPDKKIFFFEGSQGKKVLLTRSDNSLTLSADKIEISHPKNMDKETIRGFGTVRFTLNHHERSKIQEIITKHKERYAPNK